MYLHNNIEQLLINIANRGREYEKNITADYLQDIQSRYMNYLRQINNIPILIVDTHDMDFVKKPEDYQKLKKLLDNDYPNGINTIIF